MNEETAQNSLIYIGLFAAVIALLGATTTQWLDEGWLRVIAMAVTYIFGINAILLLGYEAQERASDLMRRT